MIQIEAPQAETENGSTFTGRQRNLGFLSEKRTEAKRRDLFVRARENLSLHFQLAQHRPIYGIQEIAAEFFPGKSLFVQERHRIAPARKSNGRRGAGRAGADDGDIKVLHDYLDTEISVIWR